MLRIGLSGGIGAGKSTVSSTFSDLGGVVVDGDVISREVVEPGTEGLAKLVEAFGEQILSDDGSLNRPALAAIAFSDEEKRQTLNGIVHPLVGKRRSELIAQAVDSQHNPVIVEDIPLLVESGMAPMFPLVVIVNADEDLRVKRLIEHRGFTEEDARARIAAQATEEQRRAVADVWLDNTGSAEELVEQARELWHQRILPFARNLDAGEPARSRPVLVPYDPSWPEQARRIVARLNTACGHHAVRIDHIGSTAVPGLDAKDVIDIQVTVASLDAADEVGRCADGRGIRPAADHRRRAQARRPQHCRAVRPLRRRSAVAEADSCLGRSGPADPRPSARRRLAESAVRAAVRRLAGGQSQCARGLSGCQAGRPARGDIRRWHRCVHGRKRAVVSRRLPRGLGVGRRVGLAA